jgi:hypothetical protein
MKIWIVGKDKHHTIHGLAWDLISVRSSEKEAIEDCQTVEYFYMQLEMCKNYSNKYIFNKAIYPKQLNCN